jgi:predicted transglutaminase-like cysteine proteinase
MQERLSTHRQDSRPATAMGRSPARRARPGFFRRLGATLRSYRLGDLMIAAGILQEEQLNHALALQRVRRQPLGKILVAEGYVTPVQLYRQLAEQWCIKASTAGVALMLQTFTPSTARADDSNGAQQVRLAAAFAPSAAKIAPVAAQPKLFGTLEIRSNNLAPFTKWTSTMQRFEQQMHTARAHAPQVEAWKSALDGMTALSSREKLDAVNDYVNRVRYIEDKDNYGVSDKWATPIEFLANGGDCEDFAIAKYASLRALGFSTDQLRIAVVQDKIKHVAHAILVAYTDAGAFILDNQNKRVLPAEDVNRYQIVFSINSAHWWLHRTPAQANS